MLTLKIKWWYPVIVVLVGLIAASAVVVPQRMEESQRAVAMSAIEQSLVSQNPEAALQGALEVDKVYLVSWTNSDTPHLSLYVGGLMIEVAVPAAPGSEGE